MAVVLCDNDEQGGPAAPIDALAPSLVLTVPRRPLSPSMPPTGLVLSGLDRVTGRAQRTEAFIGVRVIDAGSDELAPAQRPVIGDIGRCGAQSAPRVPRQVVEPARTPHPVVPEFSGRLAPGCAVALPPDCAACAATPVRRGASASRGATRDGRPGRHASLPPRSGHTAPNDSEPNCRARESSTVSPSSRPSLCDSGLARP